MTAGGSETLAIRSRFLNKYEAEPPRIVAVETAVFGVSARVLSALSRMDAFRSDYEVTSREANVYPSIAALLTNARAVQRIPNRLRSTSRFGETKSDNPGTKAG